MLLENLTLYKCLGKGAFGEVYLTSKQGSKDKYATKKINKKLASNPTIKKYLENEINILKEIDHPNIIKLFDVKETTQFYYLVMELCNGGSLSDCLEDYKNKYKKSFPEEIVQYLMKQIISGINYLHKKKILHRDIKLDNILVNFDNEEDRKEKKMIKAKIKIINFGFARQIFTIILGTHTPILEILIKLNKMENSRNFAYDEKNDIWSLGTICYELLIGQCAFDAEGMKKLLSKVEKGNYSLPNFLSKEVVSFLNSMLQYDAKKRLTAEQLSHHKFLTKPYSELNKINIKVVSKNIFLSRLIINCKKNLSIWTIIEAEDENEDLDNISQGMYIISKKVEIINNHGYGCWACERFFKEINERNKRIDEKTLRKHFLEAFDIINDDFIYIEPKLIPIIPGDDRSIISAISEY